MKRNIVKIDEEKCTGCGLCIDACREGALQLVDGKAKLITDAYCDGLGMCLPECPAGAIEIIEREAAAFDEEAVNKRMASKNTAHKQMPCGCPGSMARTIPERHGAGNQKPPETAGPNSGTRLESQLRQWPCQIRLAHPQAPWLNGAHVLIAADCTAYAYANIHDDFMKGRVTLIGCPKLDDADYSENFEAIFSANDIKSVTVLRMEVPCCGGLVHAVKLALANSGKNIPLDVVTVGIDGNVLGT